MVRIVKLDGEPVDAVALLLHIDKDSAASVGEAIKSVDVVDKNNLGTDLQLQFCLERRVLDTSGVIHFELLHSSAGVLGLYDEKLTLHLAYFGVVPGVNFGVGAIGVDAVVEAGVSIGTNSGFQEVDVCLCVQPYPNPV